MIERFIEDAKAAHKQVRENLALIELELSHAIRGSFSWDVNRNNQAYFRGVLAGIEETAELILGREKMEEVFGIEPDAGLVPV